MIEAWTREPAGGTIGRVARGSSPILVGRDDELRRLRDALASARTGDRPVILVSGEAGIGKSRLLTEFARSVRDDPPGEWPTDVLWGSCVDVGESLAYLPVLEVLTAAGDLDRTAAAEASDLRRAFGGASEPRSDDGIASGSSGRALQFQRLRDLLVSLAAERDIVIIIDDLHWADRSTLDVVSFLARRLAGTGALLLVAYRSDELHRRHPMKPILADLERHAVADHVRLEPLDRDAVAAQVAAILDREPGVARLDRIVDLADGNPFHVEELLSLGEDRRLPPVLREVLDARLDRLGDSTRAILGEAAAIGRDVDPALLTVVSGAPDDEVTTGILEAVDARILESVAAQRYRFRHALLREAVYDELAPTVRMATHRRIAEALRDHPTLADPRPNVAVADLARHWLAARAEVEAFTATLEAARSARLALAWAEARAANEEALALWDRLPDPVTLAGSARSVILEETSDLAWYEGDTRGALAFNQRAQAEPDVAGDALRLGRLAIAESWYLSELGSTVASGEAAGRAMTLIPGSPPSAARATALVTMGTRMSREGQTRRAIDLLEEAIAMWDGLATVGDDRRGRLDAAAGLGFVAFEWAQMGEEVRPSAAAESLAGRSVADDPGVFYAVSTTVPWVWVVLGRNTRAVEAADRYLDEATTLGLDSGGGLWYLAPRCFAEFWLGRWDDAIDTISRAGAYRWGFDPMVQLRAIGAQIAAGRGDAMKGRTLAAEAIEIAATGYVEHRMTARVAAAWVELVADQPAAAVDQVRSAWGEIDHDQGVWFNSHAVWIGLWACADLAETSRARGDAVGHAVAQAFGADLVGIADRIIERRRGADPGGAPGPMLDMALAEAARLDNRHDPQTWAGLGGRFDEVGDVPRAALARLRQADAILRLGGDAKTATAVLGRVLAHAETMGATWFRDRALALARASRLDLDRSSPRLSDPGNLRVPDPWGLSEREREVLALLAAGRTNRQIGAALFISDKTASVHVTHILDKMGVSSRTEAALLAVHAGVGIVAES